MERILCNRIFDVLLLGFYHMYIINFHRGYSNASFAYRVLDNDMEPKIKKNSFVFVELSGLLQNNDIGLFKLDEKFIIRKLLYRKSGLVLRAENTDIPDISVSLSKHFNIIGKIYI